MTNNDIEQRLDEMLWDLVSHAKNPHDRNNKFHSVADAKQAILALCRDVCGEAKPEITAHPNGPVTLADCQRGLDYYESNMLAILGQPQEEQ